MREDCLTVDAKQHYQSKRMKNTQYNWLLQNVFNANTANRNTLRIHAQLDFPLTKTFFLYFQMCYDTEAFIFNFFLCVVVSLTLLLYLIHTQMQVIHTIHPTTHFSGVFFSLCGATYLHFIFSQKNSFSLPLSLSRSLVTNIISWTKKLNRTARSTIRNVKEK